MSWSHVWLGIAVMWGFIAWIEWKKVFEFSEIYDASFWESFPQGAIYWTTATIGAIVFASWLGF